MVVMNHYVSGGCRISLSMCKRGSQDLLNARPDLKAPPPRSDTEPFLPHILQATTLGLCPSQTVPLLGHPLPRSPLLPIHSGNFETKF